MAHDKGGPSVDATPPDAQARDREQGRQMMRAGLDELTAQHVEAENERIMRERGQA